MELLFAIAHLLGTDPVSLLVLGLLAAICAAFMQKLTGRTGLAVVSFPLLVAGGLLADDAAVALGLYPVFEMADGANWDFLATWKAVDETLPNVLVAGAAGMIVSCAMILLAARCLGD